MNDIMKGIEERVKQAGFPVNVDTEFCKGFRATHPNCVGCESEAGCSRVALMALHLTTDLVFPPMSFDEFEKRTKATREKIEKILNPALSIKELDSLI